MDGPRTFHHHSLAAAGNGGLEVGEVIRFAGTITFTAFGTKIISVILSVSTRSPSRYNGICLVDRTITRLVLLRVTVLFWRHLPKAAAVASPSNSAALSQLMAAASSACSELDICSDTRGQITVTTSACPLSCGEIKYCSFVSNIF